MFEFKLPDLGEGVHEGQIINVLVKEGDPIAEYQPMLEIETDKAAVEIPSPKAGVVAKVHVQPGQVVKVGQVLLSIDDRGAAKPEPQVAEGGAMATRRVAMPEPPIEEAAATQIEPPASAGAGYPRGLKAAAPPAEAVAAEPTVEGPVPAAPAVRKLARELNVDISQVPGSGPGGRVLREDVERLGAMAAAPQAAGRAAMPHTPGAELPDFSQFGPVRREKVPQIRKTIARQMTRAWLNVPRVTHCDRADITELERNRAELNAGVREGQPKLSMTAIVVKAVAVTLRDFPVLNSSYDPAAEEIIYKDYVHIGIAVDTPRGLVVPVLRDADKKSLPQIATELGQIAERARAAKFEIAELRGATFTVTNYGAVGGTFGTPMVNYPEVGIMGLGRARLEPAVYAGQIVPRLILPLSLSFDHRIVDGADAARFTTEVIRSLENPLRLISLA